MEPSYKRARVSFNEPSDRTGLQRARRDNDLHLKSRFESIFEKYSRDFTDVADEIDLRTGELLVDKGHLHTITDEHDTGILFRPILARPAADLAAVASDNEEDDSEKDELQEDDDDFLISLTERKLEMQAQAQAHAAAIRVPMHAIDIPSTTDIIERFGENLGVQIAHIVSRLQADESRIEPAWRISGPTPPSERSLPMSRSAVARRGTDTSMKLLDRESIWAGNSKHHRVESELGHAELTKDKRSLDVARKSNIHALVQDKLESNYSFTAKDDYAKYRRPPKLENNRQEVDTIRVLSDALSSTRKAARFGRAQFDSSRQSTPELTSCRASNKSITAIIPSLTIRPWPCSQGHCRHAFTVEVEIRSRQSKNSTRDLPSKKSQEIVEELSSDSPARSGVTTPLLVSEIADSQSTQGQSQSMVGKATQQECWSDDMRCNGSSTNRWRNPITPVRLDQPPVVQLSDRGSARIDDAQLGWSLKREKGWNSARTTCRDTGIQADRADRISGEDLGLPIAANPSQFASVDRESRIPRRRGNTPTRIIPDSQSSPPRSIMERSQNESVVIRGHDLIVSAGDRPGSGAIPVLDLPGLIARDLTKSDETLVSEFDEQLERHLASIETPSPVLSKILKGSNSVRHRSASSRRSKLNLRPKLRSLSEGGSERLRAAERKNSESMNGPPTSCFPDGRCGDRDFRCERIFCLKCM